jgi:hypothetical protein
MSKETTATMIAAECRPIELVLDDRSFVLADTVTMTRLYVRSVTGKIELVYVKESAEALNCLIEQAKAGQQ